MKKKQETFATLMQEFQYHFDIPQVFDDFLTMTIASFGRNLSTGLSYDEDLYLNIIPKYKDHRLADHFPTMLAHLVMEMEKRRQSSSGNDVLGDFYQEHLYKKGRAQFFTPWHVCQMMAQMAIEDRSSNRIIRILDPCCGSGRLLIASSRVRKTHGEYYGIDLDHTCVKMSVINMFLNGIFQGEVMWADALLIEDFRMSYKLSFLPFGIFRIQQKEESLLWQINQNTFRYNVKSDKTSQGEQLQFF